MLSDIRIEELVLRALTNPKSAVNLYLMTSYLYYHRFVSVIDDSDFDNICKYLYSNFDEIEHQHKHLITKEDLKAGTGYAIKESDYPMMVKQGAWILERQYGLEDNKGTWENRSDSV